LSSSIVVSFPYAPVAQLDRAPGYEPGGREFESLRAHHISSVYARSKFPSVEYSRKC
jgi:hypothetical protein